MKFKALITVFLIGLLAGCSGTNQDTTVTSTSESQQASKSRITEPNEFDSHTKADQNNLKTPKKIGRAALLNEQQIEQLLQLEPSDEVVLEGGYKSDAGKVKALVPTYVPPGFLLDSMTIRRLDDKSPEYKLEYKNNSGKCYRLSSITGTGDAPIAAADKQIKHPILGDIAVGYTTSDFSRQGNTIISFVEPFFRAYKGKYTGYIFDSGYSPNKNTTCEAVSMEESIKIINSIVELDPSKPFDPKK
ncbi:MAG TPA: hypothetical protein VK203_14435 [Nostocaceae cyanobacterium]|nr:hypothetical protein [Nostocaceae cyanobacterium]